MPELTTAQRQTIENIYGSGTPVEILRDSAGDDALVFAYSPNPYKTAHTIAPDGAITDAWEIDA